MSSKRSEAAGNCEERVRTLEDEVRALKRRLAERDPADPLLATGKRVKRTSATSDEAYLAGLPPQDRRYMERKLGKR